MYFANESRAFTVPNANPPRGFGYLALPLAICTLLQTIFERL